MTFAKVIPLIRLPRSLGIFDYKIAPSLSDSIKIGMLVKISFRGRRVNGLIITLGNQSEFSNLEEITEILHPDPLLDESLIQFYLERARDYGISPAILFRSILPEVPTRRFESQRLKVPQFTPRGFTIPKSLVSPLTQGLSTALSSRHSTFLIDDHRLLLPFLGRLALELHKINKPLRILAPTHRDALIIAHALNQYGLPAVRFLPTDGKTRTLEIWCACQMATIPVLVGTRAALFFPLTDDSTVVLIEESSDDWKQEEINPRYDARILLSQLAARGEIRTIRLTSFVRPEIFAAIESHSLRMTDLRIHEPPPVTLLDLRSHKISGNKSALTEVLIEQISDKKSVLLFVQRRGRGSVLCCQDCRLQFRCVQCETILSVHRTFLRCPACGVRQDLPLACPSCQSTELKSFGSGIESVEEEVRLQFPHAKIYRLDREQALTDSLIFPGSQNEQTIIIGTAAILQYYSISSREQLHFDCVAIVDADGLLHRPDFRAHEKLARIVTRLSQLAAITSAPFLIQTSFPELSVWQTASRNEKNFLTEELTERQAMHYPPFFRLVKLVFQNTNEAVALAEATHLHKFLTNLPRSEISIELLGPYPASPPKIRGKFKIILLIRFSPEQYISLRPYLTALSDETVIDLDPIDVL